MGYKVRCISFIPKKSEQVGEISSNYLLSPIRVVYTLAKELEKCNNMTLSQWYRNGNVSCGAFFNDGEIILNIYNSAVHFGTGRKGSGSYLTQGLSIDMGSTGANVAKIIMIVDDNDNLVFLSPFRSDSSGKNVTGFNVGGALLTNGGMMDISSTSIYSFGATPAVMGTTLAGNLQQKTFDQSKIYQSDKDFYFDTDNILHLRDHVVYMFTDMTNGQYFSNNKWNSLNPMEMIMVDNEMYIHLSFGLWIPFDEKTDEEIEVLVLP